MNFQNVFYSKPIEIQWTYDLNLLLFSWAARKSGRPILFWRPFGDVERAGSSRSASSDVLNFKFSHLLSRATLRVYHQLGFWLESLQICFCVICPNAELQCYQVFSYKNWNIDLPFIRTVQQTYIKCVREEFQKLLAIKGQHIYHFYHATGTIFLQ